MPKETLKAVGSALTPPEITPKLMWELTVSASIFVLILVTGWHITEAEGWYDDQTRYARAADVDAVRRGQLEEKLDRVHYQMTCMTEGATLELLQYERNLQVQYRQVNENVPYVAPPCNILEQVLGAIR